MTFTKTLGLTLAAAVVGLSVLQMPAPIRDRATAEESAHGKRKSAPVAQYQSKQQINGGPVMGQGSSRTSPFTPVVTESPARSKLTTPPADRNRDQSSALARIVALENQSVDTALTELLVMLADDNPAVRRAAAESIGDINVEAAGSALATALDDHDPQVRKIALEGLSALDAGSAVGSIEPFLHDEDAGVRLAAIEALSDLESETAVHALAGLIYNQDSSIRRHAVSALGDIGGGDAVMYLSHARYDADASVRAIVYDALSALELDEAE